MPRRIAIVLVLAFLSSECIAIKAYEGPELLKSEIAVILDLYSHVMPGMQEDAAMKVDRVLKSALGKLAEA